MITGIDLAQTVEYVCKSDKKNPTTWKLGALPSYVMGQFASEATSKQSMALLFNIVRVGVKGWDNFGNIKYTTEKDTLFGRELDTVPAGLVDSIPINTITELATEILSLNQLSSLERKN